MGAAGADGDVLAGRRARGDCLALRYLSGLLQPVLRSNSKILNGKFLITRAALQVQAVAFSPDGAQAVTASRDGTWCAWGLGVRHWLQEDPKKLLQARHLR